MQTPRLPLPSPLVLVLSLAALVGCDATAGPEAGPLSAVRADGQGASGEDSRGLWQINLPPQRVYLESVGLSAISATLWETDKGRIRGQLLLRHDGGVRRHRVAEARVECAGGVPQAVLLRGTATEVGRGGQPTDLTFEARVAPSGPIIDVLYTAAGTSGDVLLMEGDVRFGLAACSGR